MFQSKFHRYHIISLGKTCRSYTLLAVLSWMRAPKKHDSATRTKEKHQGLFLLVPHAGEYSLSLFPTDRSDYIHSQLRVEKPTNTKH